MRVILINPYNVHMPLFVLGKCGRPLTHEMCIPPRKDGDFADNPQMAERAVWWPLNHREWNIAILLEHKISVPRNDSSNLLSDIICGDQIGREAGIQYPGRYVHVGRRWHPEHEYGALYPDQRLFRHLGSLDCGEGGQVGCLVSATQSSPLIASNYSNNDGKQRDDPSGISGSTCGTIGGVLIFAFGAILMKLCFYFGDAPDNPIWYVSWLIGIIAVIMVAQGTSLRC
jgi:hypothetical protein